MKSNEEMKIDEELILLALDKKTKLHLTLQDRSWRNGFVKSINGTYFIFVDDKNKGEEPIFFIELRKIDPFTKGANNE